MRRPSLPAVSAPVLVYLLVATALAALVISITMLFQRQGEQAQQTAQVLTEVREQNETIKDLLERQAQADATRQQLIDEAVARIAAEQYRALVAHDRRMEDLIRRNGRLLDREVNGPATQESRSVVVIPRPAPAPQRTVPRVGPSTGVAPAPAPKPVCRQRGKSGKCRK